jgi:hypothetical protein
MLKKLAKQLLPNGRAFRMPYNGDGDKFLEAIAESKQDAFDSAIGVLDAVLPDNLNFTSLDATQWERRLGMIVDNGASLSDRKLAIQRKMNHPGDIQARQSGDYIQQALRDAGFNVTVFWNININDLPTYTNRSNVFGANNFGIANFGLLFERYYLYGEKVVNFIDAMQDETFKFGIENNSFFVVCGSILGTPADVELERREEIRQLILRLKPLHLPCLLFVQSN